MTTPCKPNRFACCVDLEALARAGRKRLVIHVPASMYARMCKGSSDGEEAHIYIGRKRGPEPLPAAAAAAASATTTEAGGAGGVVPKEAFVIRYPSTQTIVEPTEPKP